MPKAGSNLPLLDFFSEQHSSSKIKTDIVISYFVKWCKVMVPRVKDRDQKLGYVDFYCGPGTYDTGEESTPIRILKHALNDPDLTQMLVCVFNDANPKYVTKLKEEIGKIDGVERLKHTPEVRNDKVGEEIVKEFRNMQMVPSLVFIDPFGYKGLTLDLIGSVIKDWGCDCIFFFNYNRVNNAVTNPAFTSHVNALLSESTADGLRAEIAKLNPSQRETRLLELFEKELKKIKGNFSLRYKFFQKTKSKTDHFIYFVSKNVLGHHLMKQTMADCCSKVDGVPTFEFNPSKSQVAERQQKIEQSSLFPIERVSKIDELAAELLKTFAGRVTNKREIYEQHNVGKPYIENNYKEALLSLEQQGKIVCSPPVERRRYRLGKPTLGDTVSITFK